MEKMNYSDIEKLYEGVTEDFDSTVELTLFEDFGNFNFKVYRTVSMADISVLSKLIAIATFVDGSYSELNFNLFLAKYAIEYLTNLPLPLLKTDESENEEENKTEDKEKVDLVLCYEIYRKIFDEYAYSPEGFIDESFVRLQSCAKNYVDEIREANNAATPVNELATKLLELCDYVKRIATDYIENPSALLELMEELGIDEESRLADIVPFPTPEN